MRARTAATGPELRAAAGRPLDWQYAAVVATGAPADAENWARDCLQAAPLPLRLFLTLGWRLLLLEGGARSDATHVLGWPIASSSSETAVLQRRSRLGIRATLVFVARPGATTFASGMHFDNRLARMVWACVAPVHRWAVRSVLGHASGRQRDR